MHSSPELIAKQSIAGWYTEPHGTRRSSVSYARCPWCSLTDNFVAQVVTNVPPQICSLADGCVDSDLHSPVGALSLFCYRQRWVRQWRFHFLTTSVPLVCGGRWGQGVVADLPDLITPGALRRGRLVCHVVEPAQTRYQVVAAGVWLITAADRIGPNWL